MTKDLLTIKDLTTVKINEIFSLTEKLKKNKAKFRKSLEGKTIALIFQKPSNRTRVSFEVGMFQLGGNSLYLSPNEINLGVRESIADVGDYMTLNGKYDAAFKLLSEQLEIERREGVGRHPERGS